MWPHHNAHYSTSSKRKETKGRGGGCLQRQQYSIRYKTENIVHIIYINVGRKKEIFYETDRLYVCGGPSQWRHIRQTDDSLCINCVKWRRGGHISFSLSLYFLLVSQHEFVQKCALDKLVCVTGGGGNVGGFFSATIPRMKCVSEEYLMTTKLSLFLNELQSQCSFYFE